MTRHENRYLLLWVAMTAVLFGISHAQVTTGVPPYQSFAGGPEVLNLGNLNAHYSIPVFNRVGRGSPFDYAVAYDSSVWMPSTTWLPSSNWGLHRDMSALVGYVTFRSSQTTCRDPYGGHGIKTTYNVGPYVDPAGTTHSFLIHWQENECLDNYPTGGTAVIGDGSGITVYADDGPSAIVTLKSGEVITPQLLSGSTLTGTGKTIDRNGNTITSATSNGTTTFTDTLGTIALTISGTAPSPVYYKYTAPSGANAQVTVTYVTKTVQTNFGCSGIGEYGPLSNSLLDRITLPDGSYYQFTYEQTPISGSTNVTGRIGSITLPTGGTISYDYTGFPNNGIVCLDGSASGFKRTTPDGTWTYSRSGTSPAYTTLITDPQGNQTKVQFQGNYETQRDTYAGAASGTPLRTIITCYNGNISNCTTTALLTPFTQITKFNQLNGGTQARGDTIYDGYGSVIEKDDYDFGAATPTRKTVITYNSTLGNYIVDRPSVVKVTDGSGNLKSETDFVYDEDQGSLRASGASQLSPVTCTPGYTKCRGNITTIKRYVTSSTTLNQTFTHYDTGQVYQTTDSNGAIGTNTYGACGNSLLTTLSLPLGLSKSSTWNCTGGVQTSSTDENGKVSYTTYTSDAYFWRPNSTQDETGMVTTMTYPSTNRVESVMNFNGTRSTLDAVTTLDSLGRTQVTQKRQAPGSSNFDSILQSFDSNGRLAHVSMEYVGTLGQICCGEPATTLSYDALDRFTQFTDASNTTVKTTQYSQSDVYTDLVAPATEHDKRKQREFDGLGRLSSVCEVTTATSSGTCGQHTAYQGFWTKYAYDTASTNSLTVTQNAQPGGGSSQSRTYLYDLLGRETSESNPETTGAISYYYDSDVGGPCASATYPQGNLVKRIDAVGNTTCYSYDQLRRITKVFYPSGSYSANTDTKFFVYDGAVVNGITLQNTKSRLAEVYTCPFAGSCSPKKTDLGYNYSARGEVTDIYESTSHLAGYYYHVSASYWSHGKLATLSGAGLPTVYYGASDGSGLDGEGRVTKVTTSSSQNPSLVSGVTYVATGNGTTQPVGVISQVTYGSSDYDTFTYSPYTGRMTGYQYAVGTAPQTVTGSLTWNANASLASFGVTDQLNTANSQTCSYGYDDLGRMSSSGCGSAWNQTFSFDPFGNVSKSGTSSWQATYSGNRIQTIPGCSPPTGYSDFQDANGNLLKDCTHTYSWGADGAPYTIDGVTLTYDGLGRIVEQARGSAFTEIVYGPKGGKLALMNGQTLQKAFVPLPQGATAVYNSSGLAYYRHPDWAGSSRLSTTPSRALYSDTAYAPYGENYAGSGTTDLNYTGQNQDTVSGLYDFPKREYHPIAGRWISADPAGIAAANFEDPQSWNRYAYSLNDPSRLTDRTGNYPQDQHEFFTFLLAVWSGEPDSQAQDLAQGAHDADNFWNATGLPGLSYFFGLGLLLNYDKHFGKPLDAGQQLSPGTQGGFEAHLLEDNGAKDAPHTQGVWHHILSNLMGQSVDTDPMLGGGWKAFGRKLGLPDNSPVYGLIEWARTNINAGCNGLCDTHIVGLSLTKDGETHSRGDTDVTGLTPVESYTDAQGNTVNIFDKSGTSFWDNPDIRGIDMNASLMALETHNSGDANIAEALAIYETELP